MIDGRPAVLVLMGGPDAEREVSILSGQGVAQALRDSGQVDVIEHVVDEPTDQDLAALGGDVSFPVLHGPWGEGGALQRMLDAVGLPYVGSRPSAAALAMHKLATKYIVTAAGVRTPCAQRLDAGDACDLDPPLVLKPIDDGSSVDMYICRSAADVASARARLHPARGAIMAEAYVAGREITAGIVGHRLLPLVEIIPSAAVEFYDYEAKYLRDDTRYVVDPPLSRPLAQQCRRAAMLAFDRVGCRDLARVDFMVDDEGPSFLEVNTMPGFTTHSLVPMAAAAVGLDMPALCVTLVEAALDRGGTRMFGAEQRVPQSS
ncbi:MAG: D-alanine--D-alanine ligase family protein [Planctomycetota bacterium]